MKPDFNNIPTYPGVYLFYDARNSLLYIGKAKNLRNRIRTYWVPGRGLAPDKAQMVDCVHRVDWIVVNTETEALFLEAGLIKKHQPPFNIVLRDDKSWTYIVITNEAFPRILTVRGNTRRKGEYFGPYIKASEAKTVVRLLHRILPLRTCARDLSRLPNGRVCMQYHLGHCLGPCEKLIPLETYAGLIETAKKILRGDVRSLKQEFQSEMYAASKQQQYERAAAFRNKMRALESLTNKQYVIHPLKTSLDSIGIASEKKTATIAIMQIRKGQLLDTLHFQLANKLHVTDETILESFLIQYYTRFANPPREIIIPLHISKDVRHVLLPIVSTVPQRGAKKKLLDLAKKNAWAYFHKLSSTGLADPVLYSLKELLELPELPLRIEGYDISNIGGEHAVGAFVVAKNGKLTPSEYRKFKIKSVQGANDVAMMREVLIRRQRHAEWPDPQLIVLDGGKPQLNAVYPILKESLRHRVVALAKREEEIFLPGRKNSIRVPKSKPELLLLRKIRDAVHRQAIMYYRKTHRTRAK